MRQAAAIVVAGLVGYLAAATRNWVWCPGWLKEFVLGAVHCTATVTSFEAAIPPADTETGTLPAGVADRIRAQASPP